MQVSIALFHTISAIMKKNTKEPYKEISMKKILSIITLTCIMSSFAVVWENDPSMTPEQRAKAKEINATIRKKNEDREALMNKEIAQATEKFMNEIEKIRAKYPPIVG